MVFSFTYYTRMEEIVLQEIVPFYAVSLVSSDWGAFGRLLTQALFPEEGARRAGDACLLIALSQEPGACKPAPCDAEEIEKVVGARGPASPLP